MKAYITFTVFLILLIATPSFSIGQQSATPKSWSTPYKAFRIAGNLYYVGTEDLACYLIVTPEGNILINTGLPESLPLIKSSVTALGFKMSDIKILLATHAHYDHVGAMAAVKKLTGAKMMIDEADARSLADGGNSDYALGGHGETFRPVKADRLLHDKDTVALGDMKILVLHHPGHTRGSCSFLFDVKDESRTYRVLIANMPSIVLDKPFSAATDYPKVVQDYRYTLDALKKQRFDIWLSSHGSQFGLLEKHHVTDSYHPEAFEGRKDYDSELNDLDEKYRKKTGEK